ncbi:MAG: biotin/lipoyl-binding protein [Chitinophagaceae bacterium]|nr:biotin/lipoyl-binding protein [Chitinophagaceae bacterium]
MSTEDISYKVSVNGYDFSFTKKEIDELDFVKTSNHEFHIIRGNQSITARVEPSSNDKKINVGIAGETFQVEIRDKLDQVLEKMGFGSAANKVLKDIKAPMPGLVLEIAVVEGQEMNDGDKIAILEAMKMENSIMIHGKAVIKKILVSAGQAVDKGQVLVELE